MRLLVYTDYVYTSSDGVIYAQRAFALFLARLADFVDELVIPGRLDPEPAVAHYRLPDKVTFVPLPHYPALSQPTRAIPAMLGSLKRFWQTLETVDAAWVLGPYPLSFALVALAAARRRRVVLGVRQDWPRYVRSRHPHSRSLRLLSRAMEAGYRALARVYPIVVVGPQLARNYRRSSAVLPITVSMVEEDEIAPARDRTGHRALTVGRLETEKNPILLGDILAALRRRDPRWELVICGEGPLAAALEARLSELGVAGAAQLRGYVPIDAGLHDLYRECDYFLHVSLTEGLPQVIFEAFAARLPIVATAVGGVPDAVGDAALLVPPDDADAAADALLRLADDGDLRRRLVERGVERVQAHTTSSECARIVDFVSNAGR